MEQFPKLIEKQVVVLRAQAATGIVVDENFQIALRDEQKVYTVFASLEDALLKIKEILLVRKDIECSIFKNSDELLYYFRSIENFNNQVGTKGDY